MDPASLLFLFLFLPSFLIIYLFGKVSLRPAILLIASLAFVAWQDKTAVLWLGGLVLFGYFMGRMISRAREKGSYSLVWLWMGTGVALAILAFFKILTVYGAAAFTWLHLPQEWLQHLVELPVPIGLSYLIFQMISYLVDVSRGTIFIEKNLVSFSVYLLFFPKLSSGPLIRYKPFILQAETPQPTFNDIAEGLRRLLSGFIKHALIANQLAPMANAVFNLPTANVEPKFAWLALLAYSLQLYFNFSGYTDMAIGLAMMIGIRLPENFNFPYLAQSIGDFWRRWHITLSSWFREYLFFPLERRRLKWLGQQINILIVFLALGLWHGVKPTFIVWGLVHGSAVVLESLGLGRLLAKTWRPIRHVYTLGIVLAGWVFFRSSTLDFAFEFFRRLAGDSSALQLIPFSISSPMPFIDPSFVLALAAGILFSFPISHPWKQVRINLESRQQFFYLFFQILEDVLLIFLFVASLASLLSTDFTPDIYAKF